MVVKYHQNRYKSISDVLLYTVITTGNISNTDLYLHPYRSGRDYCSEFDYLLHKGGLIDIATMKVKFYYFNFLLGLKLIYLTAGIFSSIPLSNDLLK